MILEVNPFRGVCDRHEEVAGFFRGDFPNSSPFSSGLSVADAVVAEIVGSDKIRYGAAPLGLKVQEVVRRAIALDWPIPILCPWGSKKTVNGESIDIAEVGALKQLANLASRVKHHYPGGIMVNIRVDDVSGYHLFTEQGEPMRSSSRRYCDDFGRLVRVLGLSSFVNTVPESSLFGETEFNACADGLIPVFAGYIARAYLENFEGMDKTPEGILLAKRGWVGGLPKLQCDYFRSRYARLYEADEEAAVGVLARYLSGSLARVTLGRSGAELAWGSDYLRVTFLSPVPGTPAHLLTKTVNYRTLPRQFTRDHSPPWRMKGCIELGEGLKPKLCSWDHTAALTPYAVLISDGERSVEVSSNYVCK